MPWIPAFAGMTRRGSVIPAKAGIQGFLLLVLLLASLAALAQNVLPVPELTARVIDQTGTLDAIQRQGIDDKLAAFEQKKGTQIVVLMVPTTQPEDIASYAHRVASTWKIGRKAVGDGVLLIVAKDDRRVRIEVAKTLEGAVPDLAAKQVIDEAITPNFRKGDYAAGLQAAADQLIARIDGEKLPEVQRRQPSQPITAGFDWFDLAIFVFFVVPFVARILRGIFGKLGAPIAGAGTGVVALLITSSIVVAVIAAIVALFVALLSGGGSSMGRRARGGGAPWIVPTSGGWSGGGGSGWGGGGGGGFSSGGGGDFGGGGASGDW
jgi:uncharacterized protein